MTFRPMLAAKDASKIRFPGLASPKLDGIRAMVQGGVVLSRSLKPIPNPYVQALYGHPFYEGCDGELCVGPANAKDLMQKTTSGVMSKSGKPDVMFHLFDRFSSVLPFHARMATLGSVIASGNKVVQVDQVGVSSQADLDAYEAICLERGYEGAMYRDPTALYKQGRATATGGELTKIKRFEDAEAIVVSVHELVHNENEATLDELGHTKRSSHKANLRPGGVMGYLKLRTPAGIEFDVGTGFTADQRDIFWRTRGFLVGKIAKYKSFTATGVKDKPRIPVFITFRNAMDMSSEET